ncbi:melatonin receptor type 1B-like [Actinia tenebrosa]|uniref:Melatonin receptor type 1B-like n=1 Tax=Actinia tenebrosa TaxID=6105 RepID=A0A6P8IDH7_ACTTE|nr:melatonin receptor type 1B-like [Actinia tenebrosa]
MAGNIADKDLIQSLSWLRKLLPLCILIVVANLIALAVFLKRSLLVKKSTYLLVNLTIADLLVGFSGVILEVLWKIFPSLEYTYMHMIYGGFVVFSTSSSILTLAVISVERVIAVFWPFHHRLAKRWHFLTTIGFVWLLSVVAGITYSFFCRAISNKRLSAEVNYSIISVASLSTILASYLSIWIKMTFFTKFRRSRTIQENSKLTKTLFIVTLVSLGTWMPRTVADIVLLLEVDTIVSKIEVYQVVYIVFLSNSFLNLAVYLFKMPEFTKELRNLCICGKCT